MIGMGKLVLINSAAQEQAHAYHKHERANEWGPPPTVNAGQELQKPSWIKLWVGLEASFIEKLDTL